LVTRGRIPGGPMMMGVLESEVNAADESWATNGSGCHSSTRSSTSCIHVFRFIPIRCQSVMLPCSPED
jgi:hypothetical protein